MTDIRCRLGLVMHLRRCRTFLVDPVIDEVQVLRMDDVVAHHQHGVVNAGYHLANISRPGIGEYRALRRIRNAYLGLPETRAVNFEKVLGEGQDVPRSLTRWRQ